MELLGERARHVVDPGGDDQASEWEALDDGLEREQADFGLDEEEVRQEDLGDRVGGIDEAGEVLVVDAVEDLVHVTERGECCAEVSLGKRSRGFGLE